MTPYKMEVQMINKNNQSDIINFKTFENWVGGQQAIIKASAEILLQNYIYRIIFYVTGIHIHILLTKQLYLKRYYIVFKLWIFSPNRLSYANIYI